MSMTTEQQETWEARARKIAGDEVLWWAGENCDGSGLMISGSITDGILCPSRQMPDTWEIMITREGSMWHLGIYSPNGYEIACHNKIANEGITRHLTVFEALAQIATEPYQRLIIAIREGDDLPEGWTLNDI